MKKDSKINISIQGGGLSYQAEVSQQTAGQIIAICLSGDVTEYNKPMRLHKTHKYSNEDNSKESPSEYYNRHSPQRNPDKILTLAGYINDIKHTDSFHLNEIKSLFRDVGEVLPANINRDIQMTVRLGWIAPDPNKKRNYYITNTGTKVLSEDFPKKLYKAARKSVTRRKKDNNHAK